MVLSGVDIYVRCRHKVDPYFHLPMPRSLDGWRRVWFFLMNDVDVATPSPSQLGVGGGKDRPPCAATPT
jgi:hypothetical protein